MRTKRERHMKAGGEVERERSIRALRRELAERQAQMQHLDVESAKAQTRLENMIERLNTDYRMTVEMSTPYRSARTWMSAGAGARGRAALADLRFGRCRCWNAPRGIKEGMNERCSASPPSARGVQRPATRSRQGHR
ncbi:MAG: hypothetical protein V8T10_00110 [Merdibacter sp.]